MFAVVMTDRRVADTGHTPDRRGVRIKCSKPGCAETFQLTDGVGEVGSKVWWCPTSGHGWFGPGADPADR